MIPTFSTEFEQCSRELHAIAGQLAHYRSTLVNRKTPGVLHYSVHSQLAAWIKMIVKLEKQPQFGELFPFWTPARLESLRTSLEKISDALDPHVQPHLVDGCASREIHSLALTPQAGDALAARIASEME